MQSGPYFYAPSQINDTSQGLYKATGYSEYREKREILANYYKNIEGKEQKVETIKEEPESKEKLILEWNIKFNNCDNSNLQHREMQQHYISLRQEMPVVNNQKQKEITQKKDISEKKETTQERQITQVSQYNSKFNQQPSSKMFLRVDNFEQLRMLNMSTNLPNAATTNIQSQRPKPTFPQMSTQKSILKTQNSISTTNSTGVKRTRKHKSSKYIYLEGDDYLEYKNVLVINISRNPINNIIEISRKDNEGFQENVIANLEDELDVGSEYTFKMKLVMEYMNLRFYLLSRFN